MHFSIGVVVHFSISIYRYKWRKEGHPIPPILLGTDDAGIFATNIYNEYCNIYCQFVYTKKMDLNDVIHFIREIDYNSDLYKFT